MRVLSGLGLCAFMVSSAQFAATQARPIPAAAHLPKNQNTAVASIETSSVPTLATAMGGSGASAEPRPASLFDAIGTANHPVRITVEVHGNVEDVSTTKALPFRAGGEEII